MKLWTLMATVVLGSKCPEPCVCYNGPNEPMCVMMGLTEFPDISQSPDIENFILLGNNITTLPQLANQLPRLKQLNLSKNQLTSIRRGSLPGSIEVAWLDENKIETISRRVFSNLSNLKRISLQNNQIRLMETGSFLGLPSLIELKLANNQLTKIPKLTDSQSLELLDLSNNRLSEVDGSLLELPNLTHLHLQGNSILQVNHIKLPVLRVLRLGGNRLETLDKSILESQQITLLDLSANPIESLPDNIFERLTEFKTLDVEGTKLRQIPKIPEGKRFNDLNLKDIPLFCGCENMWLIQYSKEYYSRNLDEAKCQSPAELSGVRLSEIDDSTIKKCNIKVVDDTIDECASFECNHGGKCQVDKNGPYCVCHHSWGGERCTDLLTPVTTEMAPIENGEQLWIDHSTQNAAKVGFVKGTSVHTKLRLYIKKEGNFIPDTARTVKSSDGYYTFNDLTPNSEYKVCLFKDPECVTFATKSEAYSRSTYPDYTVMMENTEEPVSVATSIGMTETVGGICGAVILLVIMAIAVLFIRRKWRYEGALKSTNSNSSGCEETNTWKYSSGGSAVDRSDNLTPNSYYSNTDSYLNNYPDVTHHKHQIQYHYQPPIQSTPTHHVKQLSQSNRHSAIIQDNNFHHFRTASTPPQPPPPNTQYYQPAPFGTAPRDQTYQI